ncbi:unnamed protein product, partial [Arabidopsis halleri]
IQSNLKKFDFLFFTHSQNIFLINFFFSVEIIFF